MSHGATGECVEIPLVGVWQHARNRFFIKHSQALGSIYKFPIAIGY